MSEREFDCEADGVIDYLFTKGFGTCRSDGAGGYSVTFRFQHLTEAQKAYRDLCMSYMRRIADSSITPPDNADEGGNWGEGW